MKKVGKSILFVLLMAVLVCGLTGCGDKKNDTSKDNTKSNTEKVTLVGSWKYESGSYTYTFNEDGTGTYDAAGTKMEFTYTTEGNKISILYTGNTSPFETEYSINGDTLNVIDSLGNDTLYKRVK
ncbi:MAG: hypothetical protein IKD76_00515 [Clostridia bacterium]|nr:hypothetical protein [Clostridia bacterium]